MGNCLTHRPDANSQMHYIMLGSILSTIQILKYVNILITILGVNYKIALSSKLKCIVFKSTLHIIDWVGRQFLPMGDFRQTASLVCFGILCGPE